MRCDILGTRIRGRHVNVITEMSWSFTDEIIASLEGRFEYAVDVEGFATPYYIGFASPVMGRNFRFTEEWFDSMSLANPELIFQSLSIQDGGLSVNVQATEGIETWFMDARYNSDGILVHLDIIFGPLYPAGYEGPNINGYITLDLHDSSLVASSSSSTESKTAGSSSFEIGILGILAVEVIRRRKNSRRRIGHRQKYMQVTIDKIEA